MTPHCMQVPDLLSPRGRMYMIALQENDPEEIMESARAMGLQADIVLHRVADQERLCVIRIVRQG